MATPNMFPSAEMIIIWNWQENDTGSMTYEVEEYDGDTLTRKIVYNDIPLTSEKPTIPTFQKARTLIQESTLL